MIMTMPTTVSKMMKTRGTIIDVKFKWSANGKSNILRIVKENAERKIAVIADGAAFGAEIEELAEIQRKSNRSLALYLPEFFERLILKPGLVRNSPVPELQNPEQQYKGLENE
jgi:hypothetical protein